MSRVLQSVYAGSSAELRTSYADKAGAAAAPNSLSYRIVNPATAADVREATEVEDPDEVVDILLKPADNTLAAGSTQERRRVIVTAGYGVDDVLVGVYEYLVISPG